MKYVKNFTIIFLVISLIYSDFAHRYCERSESIQWQEIYLWSASSL